MLLSAETFSLEHFPVESNPSLVPVNLNPDDPAERYKMAIIYETGGQWHGKKIKKNIARALNYITQSAQQGYFKAQYKLAMMYAAAENVNKNYAITRIYLTRSAQQNYPQAQYMMGVLYNEGRVFKKNEKLAIEWLLKASENNNPAAQHYLARYYLNKKNYKFVFFWLEKAVKLNYQPAMIDMGYLYYHGQGVTKDYSKARALLQTPAENNVMQAQYMMGKIFYTGGYNTDKDWSEAKKWFQKAEKSGSFDAKKYLMSLRALKNKNKNKNKMLKKSKKLADEKKITAEQDKIIVVKNEVLSDSDKPKTNQIHPVKLASTTSSLLDNILPVDNQSFAELNDNDYVIQIIQAKIPESIKNFIKQREEQTLSICLVKQNEQMFYIVTHGHFSGYSEAKKVAEALSELKLFNKLELWIRPARQIKALLIL